MKLTTHRHLVPRLASAATPRSHGIDRNTFTFTLQSNKTFLSVCNLCTASGRRPLPRAHQPIAVPPPFAGLGVTASSRWSVYSSHPYATPVCRAVIIAFRPNGESRTAVIQLEQAQGLSHVTFVAVGSVSVPIEDDAIIQLPTQHSAEKELETKRVRNI